MEQVEICLELDPLSPILKGHGRLLVTAGRYDDAIRVLNRAAELDPNLGLTQL